MAPYNAKTLKLHITRKDKNFEAVVVITPLSSYSKVAENIENILYPTELAYFRKLVFKKRQSSYSMGRFSAKLAVKNFIPEERMNAIEVASGLFGNPLVRYPAHDVPSVCITHDDKYAVSIAYPDVHPMSIDLESIHEEKISVIKSQCAPEEIKLYDTCSIPEAVFYTLLWTIKESISKAIRCGLTIPLKLLSVKNFTPLNEYEFISEFNNFGQYKAYSFVLNNHVFSLALPFKSSLHLDINELKSAII